MKRNFILKIVVTLLITVSSIFSADFAAGDGSESNPWQVSSAEELNSVRDHLKDYFIQTEDIDLSSYSSGEGWLPIGTESDYFEGSYNGNGKKITNLKINRPSSQYVSLFGLAHNASFTNIHLVDIDINGANFIAGLVGLLYDASYVSGCSVSGNITGSGIVGGLVGEFKNNGDVNEFETVEQCFVDVKIIANSSFVGGIVGLVSDVVIKECASNISIKGDDKVGGIVGSFTSSEMYNCYSTGSIEGISKRTGGILGYYAISKFENVYFSGTVSAPEKVGPIVGLLFGNFPEIKNMYYNKDEAGEFPADSGTALSESEMKQQASFAGFDFSTIWAIEEGSSYPTLQWQTSGVSVKTLENKNDDKLLIFPNPVTDMVNIATSINDGDLFIMDKNENVMFEMSDKASTDISSLKTGVYYGVVKKGNKIEAVKSFYKR